MVELDWAIDKLRRGKAAGPDEIPMEFYKEMADRNREEIFDLLNDWWRSETVNPDELKARVVLIFKRKKRQE